MDRACATSTGSAASTARPSPRPSRSAACPVARTQFWKSLPADTRWEVARRSACFLLSNFLHGEQGALMVAGQLVAAVPHMDGKFYAATQTLDEARHVEAFAAYVRLLDDVTPISPGLKKLLDNVLAAEDWRFKAVGMQVVAEGLALYAFRDMRNTTREPLLQQLLTYVARDEARHTGYGIKYLSAVVPQTSDAERAALEDFAFESARLLIDSRAGLSMRDQVLGIWKAAGVDPLEAMRSSPPSARWWRRRWRRAAGGLGPGLGLRDPDAPRDRPLQRAHPRALRGDVRGEHRDAARARPRDRGRRTCPTTSRPG